MRIFLLGCAAAAAAALLLAGPAMTVKVGSAQASYVTADSPEPADQDQLTQLAPSWQDAPIAEIPRAAPGTPPHYLAVMSWEGAAPTYYMRI